METCETVGFIDIGTNSVHVLVSRFYPDAACTPVYEDKEQVRLGAGVFRCGRMSPSDIERTALVVRRFASIARDRGASKVVAYATCACREASNANELIDALKPDVDIEVISGSEEARLVSLGVLGPHGPSERTLGIDIGGGSTEIYLKEGEDMIVSESLGAGAIRFAYGMGVDCSAPVSDADFNRLRHSAGASCYHSAELVKAAGYARAVGSAGTFQALGALCGVKTAPGRTVVRFADLVPLLDRIRALDSSQRVSVMKVGANRSDIIVAGGAIAIEVMLALGVSEIEISQDGLKQGMQTDHMLGSGYPVNLGREGSAMALGRRCSFDERHAQTVRRNALWLYDRFAELGMVSWDWRMRGLLSYAALLHDVGEVVTYKNHNILSQAIIENSEMEHFSSNELRLMGLMARYHHMRFPGPDDRKLSKMPAEESRMVRICSMALRMADVMDRHRSDAIHHIEADLEDGTLIVVLHSDVDIRMEVWSLEKLASDFRSLFGVGLLVRTGAV